MAWLGRFDDFNITSGAGYERESNDYRSRPSSSSFNKNCNSRDDLHNQINQDHFPALGSGDSGFHQICEIHPSNTQNVSIIGIVIAKDGPRSVISKKGNERHLLSLTVRDSVSDFVNVTCWGNEDFINMTSKGLCIGDVVEIKSAQVQAKSSNPSDERFRPYTPCSFHLNVSENHSTVLPYGGDNNSVYSSLIHIPTHGSNDFYTLEDIQANGMNLHGEHVNILAAVRKVWPAKEITTKTGKKTSKVDVVLFDETCDSFSLTLWDSFVTQADSWIPFETVVFAADVKITYNDFRSTMVATADSKTIFTVNPDTQEANTLYEFSSAQGTGVECLDTGSIELRKDPDVATITDVFSVQDVKDRIAFGSDLTTETVYGVIYAFLSCFDIDGETRAVLRYICPACRHSVEANSGFVCTNAECGGGDLNLDGHELVEYSLGIGLSDQTGTLESCSILPSVAEKLIGYKAQEFCNLSGMQKTSLKWEYLMERVKAVVKIKTSSTNVRDKWRVKVLALEKVPASEILEKLSSVD